MEYTQQSYNGGRQLSISVGETFYTAIGMQQSSAAGTAGKYDIWPNQDVDLLFCFYIYITVTKGIKILIWIIWNWKKIQIVWTQKIKFMHFTENIILSVFSL